MKRLAALLWDVDGTLAETERDGHRVAFNRAFEAAGLPWRWDVLRYGQLLRVTGGRERLLADLATRPGAPGPGKERDALAARLHETKNALYEELVRSGRIRLRPGVESLLDECRARGCAMAIATTTSRSNVDALLARHLGASWAARFASVICGEDVRNKKPHPEVYLRVLAELSLAPNEVLAIEDSPPGLAAARGAGVHAVITRSAYFAQDRMDGAAAIGPGLHTHAGWWPQTQAASEYTATITLDDLEGWWRGAASTIPSLHLPARGDPAPARPA